MVTIVTRAGKGSELTHNEVDANFNNLDAAITGVSNFASPNGAGIVVGNYYDNAFYGAATGTLAGSANRTIMSPFYTAQQMRIDQIGVAISTGVASASLKCFIYSSDSSGWPDALLFEGSSNLDGSTTGYKNHTIDFTFSANTRYWVGLKMSSTATYRTVALTSSLNFGLSSSSSTAYSTSVLRSLTYANSLPSSWTFTSADLSTLAPPSIRMRAAAL